MNSLESRKSLCKSIVSSSLLQFVYNPDLFDTELSDEDQPARSDEAPMHKENEKLIPQKNKKKVHTYYLVC